jgi:LDH2 family malate/lactate/ureidoglycolate dehydrogenase
MPDEQPGKGIGHFLGAMRIDAFRPAGDFKQHMDQWISRFRNAKTIAGEEQVVIPGDPERKMEEIRMRSGIPLLAAVEKDLLFLSEKLDVPL